MSTPKGGGLSRKDSAAITIRVPKKLVTEIEKEAAKAKPPLSRNGVIVARLYRGKQPTTR